MPRPFPIEFRPDVVAVARKGQAPLAQIARDFGICGSCLHRWLRLAGLDEGVRAGPTRSESAGLRELRKRNKLLGAGERDLAAGGGVLRPRDRPPNEGPAGL